MDEKRLREFAERGFLVLPQAIPEDLIARATETIDAVVTREPPPPETRGFHFYFPDAVDVPSLIDLFTLSPAYAAAESLTGPGTLRVPVQAQISLNIPPYSHRPGGPHIDAHPIAEEERSTTRPGTFTILVGVLMSDQAAGDSGNLWVWPGTHHTHAEYFRANGPDRIFETGGHVPIALSEPEQLVGRAGDLVLMHYLLGHNMGGNMSERTRRAVYLRVTRHGHEERWREFLQDPWLEYDGIRSLDS